MPGDVENDLRTLDRFAGLHRRSMTAAELAALWAACVLTQAAAVATVVPLFLLVRLDFSRQTAWRAAALWPLVPALAIFLPKSDALYPLGTTLLAWLSLSAVRRGSALRGAAAGAVAWCGLMLSLAFLPAVALGGCVFVWHLVRGSAEDRRSQLKSACKVAVGGVGAFAVLTLIAWLAWSVNMPAVWLWNYRNHAAFYSQFPRTWTAWLAVNPLEFAFAVGLPVVAVLAAGLALATRRDRIPTAFTAALYSCLLVAAVLWLSGKNMGEAARLWLPFLPWAIWLTAPWWAADASQPRRLGNWSILLAVQAAACAVTVLRVTGFDGLQM